MRLNGILLAGACATLAVAVVSPVLSQTTYNWQRPHATVLQNGDLVYAPQPFAFTPGASVVYIDFDGGNDNNSGTSTTTAFKHHPWDPAATGTARTTSGVKTYVFKRGVIYRGSLVADESGTAGNPIILTSDPAWGSGEAFLSGSERVATTWTRCTPADAITNLNPANVWYTDLGFTITDNPYGSFPTWASGVWVQTICEMGADSILSRINLARAPNWTITNPNDPMGGWWNVVKTSPTRVTLGASFPQTAASDWIGGSVWCTYGTGSGAGANMATHQQGVITAYASGGIEYNVWSDPGCKYFVENLPQLLDEPNEYYYCAGADRRGRLYLRLSGDRDPNTTRIEVGARPKIVSVVDKSNIKFAGLTFAITNQPRPGTGIEPPHWNDGDGACPAIELGGSVANIEIANNKFRYVTAAIAPRRDDQVNPSAYNNVKVLDNDLAFIDAQGICLGSSGTLGTNRDLQVLRNKIYFIGQRQTTRNYSAVPAINVIQATSAEIAGNFVDYSAGSGINTSWKTGTGAGSQIRALVHHNKVTNTLLMLNDYGGIEGWQNGPSYFFCNISGNARGFRHFSGDNIYNPWGHAIYFDHAERHVAFNNIVYGLGNNTGSSLQRNNSGFMQAVASTNSYFNNTIYRLYRAFNSNSPMSTYVGNLMDDISYHFFEETNPAATLSYAKNVFHGTPSSFSESQSTFSAFQTFLTSGNAAASQVGLQTTGAVMTDPANGDYRPSGQAIGAGARIFLPWNLASIVGQWSFLAYPSNYTQIKGENDPAGSNGNMLTCPGATTASFVNGALEDWTRGALHFDGSATFCNTTANTALDMTTNNFIVEAYLRSSAGGTIVSKAASAGYILDINSSGNARMRLLSGGEYSISSTANVRDGNWHHIVAEVNRTGGQINLYVDGALSNGTTSGTMPGAGASLTNAASFEVGRHSGAAYLTGDLDFLRVAKSSFTESATSYDELYKWQFDGPAVRDFSGMKFTGVRDAGALMFQNIGARRSMGTVAAAPKVMVRYVSASKRYLVNIGTGLNSADPVRFTVLNAAGRVVFDKRTTAGALGADRTVEINTAAWARGVLLLRVTTPGHSQVERLTMYR